MINQTNREEIIKLLDKSEESVKLEDLFLYDLSPYYVEKQNDSFFSKQLEYIQERDQLKHNTKISFTSEQIRIYKKIVEYSRSIVSAPTSFGKTMLIKEFIYNYEPNRVVFIVPTNALADELLDDFKYIYEEKGYTIFDSVKSLEPIYDKSIFIGTQEKYYNLIELYEDIDLFVIDEAYKLTDPIKGSREVILNRSFIDTLGKSDKIILLMPLVNSIIGLEHLNFEILKSDYAPIAKNFTNVIKLDDKIVDEVNINKSINIVYFSSPYYLENFYLRKLASIKYNISLSDEWIQRVEDDFHPEWIPIKSLKSGIGIHYGPMPKFIQKKVVELFKEKEIKNILATSSIIEGVNTPTKNIYIYSSGDILGKNDLVKFKNLIGRAGRLGEHKVGNIFFWKKHEREFEEANVDYKDIDIKFVLENNTDIIEINRGHSFSQTKEDNNLSNDEYSSIKNYLKDSTFSDIPQIEISNLLNKYGFTINHLKVILDYIEEKKKNNEYIYFIGILRKLLGKRIDTDCLRIALNHKYQSFIDMTNALLAKSNSDKISKTVASLIKMVYNEIPFKIIPIVNFTLEINNLHNSFGNTLLTDKVITQASKIKAQFFSKYIGNIEEDGLLIIMNSLFEYGVPYHRAKPFLSYIANKLPNKFSIHHIKKIIMENDSMKDLQVYFE